MTLTRLFFAAMAILGVQNSYAITDNLSSSVIVLECNPTPQKTLHLTCKTADAAIVNESLINYDVKNEYGKILATGTGNEIVFDEHSLTSGSEYTINVFALVNGVVEAQTISRKVGSQ
ncbi:MAG: hypothetical protein U0T73_04440 [Chitinophagales bacterium]